MSLLKARDMYRTGIESIDDEHQLIMVYIEELHCLLKTSDDKASMLESCNRLFNALRAHYDHEERLMLKYFFPDTEGHIGQHMKFLGMIRQLVQLINDEDFINALRTIDFILDWKWNHIIGADKKYADFISVKPA